MSSRAIDRNYWSSEVAFSDMGGAALEQFSERERQQMEFTNATRVQKTIVTGTEKKVLLWLAKRMPQWVNSDHLTLLGFVAQFLVGVSYALAPRNPRWLIAATVFLAINWFGDSLDGTLARVRDRQRPRYGFYVDHVIDSFGAVFLCVGLALSGYMTPMVAIILLVAFLMLSIETYLATYCLGRFNLGHFFLGPTEIRLILGIGNVALLYKPHVHFIGVLYPLFDLGGVIASIGMFLVLVVSAIRHTMVLYREERLP
ncbi:MAG TPA: CDP-alcohol phosphatidyltransferase family protein [Terriglobales bacterium]|nr:CDP-alcohol phosphatidyltransferase family protein [Terriglobales bacterium]